MKAYLSRRYRFSASHRLDVASMSPEANQMAYGKCNNPFGHGHNYTAEVCFGGPIDPVTGMVTNLADLDAFAAAKLLDPYECSNLNTKEPFAGLVPTTENLAIVLHGIFAAYPHAKLERIHIEETSNNSFDYTAN